MSHITFELTSPKAPVSEKSEQSCPTESVEPLPLDAIIPLIEAAWSQEKITDGDVHGQQYAQLLERTAALRQQLNRRCEPVVYHRLASELAALDSELCRISQRFDAIDEEDHRNW